MGIAVLDRDDKLPYPAILPTSLSYDEWNLSIFQVLTEIEKELYNECAILEFRLKI